MEGNIQRYGVDFDGTLAKCDESGYIPDKTGEPITTMVNRVKSWISQGHEVVIFTARVNPKSIEDAEIARKAIQAWCLQVFGKILEVTCMKDKKMTRIFDDLAITVEENTGRILTLGFEDDLDHGAGRLLVLIQNCARCGGEHTIVFRRLRNSCENFTHWGTCPETGEPVMMEIEKEEPDALGSLLAE